jgi:hypothetical protein
MALRTDGVLTAYVGTMTFEQCELIKDTSLWADFCTTLKGSFSTSSWKPVHYSIYMESWGGWCMFFGASRVDPSDWIFDLDDCYFIKHMRNVIANE